MPILSLNFNNSKFSYLYIDSKNEQSYWEYPYTYKKQIYSHFYSPGQYYSDLVNHIVKKHKISLTKTAIITTGLEIPNTIGKEVSFSLSLRDLFLAYDKFNFIYLDYSNIFTRSQVITDINDVENYTSTRERDFMINYKYYQTVFPTNLSQYDAILNRIYKVLSTNSTIQADLSTPNKNILFIDSHYYPSQIEYEVMYYFYLLSSITKQGIGSINLAQDDKLIHYLLVSSYLGDYKYLVDEYSPLHLGTLANYPSDLACLIKTSIGSQQLVEMKTGQLFFLPLDPESLASINIKAGPDIIEKDITGGKLGFIIDTRNKSGSSYNYDILRKDMEINQKNLQEALSRI